jgi:F-type H+-transporting ATPase subunit epsilon
MPPPTLMNLKVLLPFRIFAEKTGVTRIVAETQEGSFGLLPHRLDCVAALAPGILIYENEAEGEVYVAVDEGVLIKTGLDVLVSVRNAIAGTDLGQLRGFGGAGVSEPGRTGAGRALGAGENGERFHPPYGEFHMADESQNKPLKPKPPLSQEVGSKAARKLRARRHVTRTVWFGLGMMGLIGWSVAIPTLLGAALGLWLDSRHQGSHSWTLALLVIGLRSAV